MPAAATIAALRFGTGLVPGGAPPAGAAALLDDLSGPDPMPARHPAPSSEAVRAMILALREARAARKDGTGSQQDFRAAQARLVAAARGNGVAQIARAVAAPVGFRERLVAFWADHFTVIGRGAEQRPMVLAFADEAIRPHVAGRFADMLRAAILHPAMLVYLEQNVSVGPNSAAARRGRGLNENLGRELLELHTLGVGAGYGQDDVRQMALLLTGLGWSPQAGMTFRPEAAEPGAETVLGRAYGGPGRARIADVEAALDDLARRPETLRHLSRKLAVHFCADDPDPDLVATIEAAWRAHDGALVPVCEALLSHPAAWDSFGQKIRQPQDFLVAALRALAVGGDGVAALAPPVANKRLFQPLRRLGQPIGEPAGPDGWPEAADVWLTSQGLAGRIDWAMTQPPFWSRDPGDPRLFLRNALADAAGPVLTTAVARAESGREAVGLVLASPDFNRR
ncbi:DUF1800 domain-containing protein [Frigidibacter sp. MR17.24]|uniref:DUF1800 domain-containing protein n=1 Tax=Frigidibacter sp. MR17.24 TaxID=3127345 RepID=UPI003012E67A